MPFDIVSGAVHRREHGAQHLRTAGAQSNTVVKRDGGDVAADDHGADVGVGFRRDDDFEIAVHVDAYRPARGHGIGVVAVCVEQFDVPEPVFAVVAVGIVRVAAADVSYRPFVGFVRSAFGQHGDDKQTAVAVQLVCFIHFESEVVFIQFHALDPDVRIDGNEGRDQSHHQQHNEGNDNEYANHYFLHILPYANTAVPSGRDSLIALFEVDEERRHAAGKYNHGNRGEYGVDVAHTVDYRHSAD